jgi:hypothetical protein
LSDADRFFLDVLEELAGELEIHVRFEQHPADFAEAFLDVGLVENSATAEPGEYAFQILGQLLEHRPAKLAGGPASFNDRVLAI